jgi:hypothetical protein
MKGKAGADSDNNIAAGREILPVEPKGLTDNALYPVSVHGTTGFFGDTDTKPVP